MARLIYLCTHRSHFGGSNGSRWRRDANTNHDQGHSALTASVLVLALISPALASNQQGQPEVRAGKQAGRISSALFRTVMQTVAEGWNRGDARLAASCFAENAVYSGPPSPPHIADTRLCTNISEEQPAVSMRWNRNCPGTNS